MLLSLSTCGFLRASLAAKSILAASLSESSLGKDDSNSGDYEALIAVHKCASASACGANRAACGLDLDILSVHDVLMAVRVALWVHIAYQPEAHTCAVRTQHC